MAVILDAGIPKAGKTVSALTFPGKKLVLDWDDGLLSARHARWEKDYPEVGIKKGDLIVEDWNEIDSVDLFVKRAISIELKTADSNDFKKGAVPEYAKDAPGLIGKYNTVMDELHIDGCLPNRLLHRDPKLPPLTEEEGNKRIGPYQTITNDTATQMFRMWKSGVMFTNKMPRLTIPDYGTLQGMFFEAFVPTLKSLNDRLKELYKVEPWIFVLVHEDMEKDELTGAIQEFPVGPSRAQGKLISEAFDESWRQTMDAGHYVWRTRNHGRWNSAGSRTHLPDFLKPACYKTVKKYFKED